MPGVIDAFCEESARNHPPARAQRLPAGALRLRIWCARIVAIPDCPLPEGLEVRPYQPEHLRKIWDASNEAFKDHWGYIAEPWESTQRMQHE